MSATALGFGSLSRFKPYIQQALSQRSLARVLEEKQVAYKEMSGEAAFYGSKIDVMIV